MAREYVSIDLDWEHYCSPAQRFATEDEWWDHRGELEAEAEAEAREYAESSAELYEFDSDEERDTYIELEFAAKFDELMAEYENAL